MSKLENVKVNKKTTNKSSKKKVVKKPKVIKDLSLWALNENNEIEKVIVPLKYKLDYIKRFGVMEITNKTELKTWLENIKLVG
jgi:hypothetical protein